MLIFYILLHESVLYFNAWINLNLNDEMSWHSLNSKHGLFKPKSMVLIPMESHELFFLSIYCMDVFLFMKLRAARIIPLKVY